MGQFLLNAASSCFVGLLCLTLPSVLQVESTAVYERLDAAVNKIQVDDPLQYAANIRSVLDNKHDLDAKVVTAMKDFIQLSELTQDLNKTCSIDTVPFLERIEKSLGLKGQSCRVQRKDSDRVRNKICDFVDSLILDHAQKCQLVLSDLYHRIKKTGSKGVYNFAEKMGQELTAQLVKLTMYRASDSITGSSALKQQVKDSDAELVLMTKLFSDCEHDLKKTKGQSTYEGFTECLVANGKVVLYTSRKLSTSISKMAIFGILDRLMLEADDIEHDYLNPHRLGSSYLSNSFGLVPEKFNAIYKKYLLTPCDEVVYFLGGAMFDLLSFDEKRHGDMLRFYQLDPKDAPFINAWLGFNACKMVQKHSQVRRNLLKCGTSKKIDPSKTFREISQSNYLRFV